MIKFFRRIRHRLLNEGKLARYFMYAIGEIILVVIGILIALQVNNWNVKRIDRTYEAQILKQLKTEYQINLDQLIEKNQIRKELIMPSASWLLSAIDDNRLDADLDSLNFHIARTFIVPSFDPINGVSQELIGTGRLQILQSDSLRVQLTQWPSIIEDFLLREEKIYASFIYEQYGSFLVQNYQLRPIVSILQNDGNVNKLLFSDNYDFAIGYSNSSSLTIQLKGNQDFEDYLALIMGWCNYLNKGTEHVIDVNRKLLELINK